ncbi:hypothetical protein Bpro_4675 [Polaromonas sp. JS666]|nr:hypothetical protein Bpro_4675 [Polaromonas sp. JS666]
MSLDADGSHPLEDRHAHQDFSMPSIFRVRMLLLTAQENRIPSTTRPSYLVALRARSGIGCAFGRRIRDALPGAGSAVWPGHTSESQQRSAPEAGESNVQVIPERALNKDFHSSNS